MIESSAIVLAGGRNSRMGYQNKSFLKLGESNFIEIVLEKVKEFNDIIIVTNAPDEYEYLGIKIVKDIFPFTGPLGAIYTGLKYAKYDNSIIFPCDMPFVNHKLLEHIAKIAKGYDGVVPKVDGYYQPLCSAYSKKCIEIFGEGLKNGITKIIDLYPLMNIYYMTRKEIEQYGNYDDMFININTPREYEKHIKEDLNGHRDMYCRKIK